MTAATTVPANSKPNPMYRAPLKTLLSSAVMTSSSLRQRPARCRNGIVYLSVAVCQRDKGGLELGGRQVNALGDHRLEPACVAVGIAAPRIAWIANPAGTKK